MTIQNCLACGEKDSDLYLNMVRSQTNIIERGRNMHSHSIQWNRPGRLFGCRGIRTLAAQSMTKHWGNTHII